MMCAGDTGTKSLAPQVKAFEVPGMALKKSGETK
jgi:hypothetical protein